MINTNQRKVNYCNSASPFDVDGILNSTAKSPNELLHPDHDISSINCTFPLKSF